MIANKHSELACWIALQRVPGIGPVTYQKLLQQYGNPQYILNNPGQITGFNDELVEKLRHPDWQQVEQDLLWLEQDNRYILTIEDERYPSLLKEITDPPCLLYVQGDISLLNDWQLAIVGSRNPSPSGRNTAYDFAHYLAEGGLVVTSGLAMGIDAAAHKGALSKGENNSGCCYRS